MASRVGVVSYVNTLPLIDGLEKLSPEDLALIPGVPSQLIDLLIADEVDLALCSIIDYQRSPIPLDIIEAGLLGCDGTTMTVRLFSQVPLDRVTCVHADTDSHTSVALCRILLIEKHGVASPELVPLATQDRDRTGRNPRAPWPEAMLLIGDKVVTQPAPAVRYPYQMDLGAEWKELTGLPFVFASWLAKRDRDVSIAAAILDRQRRHNKERLDWILAHRTGPRGWPADLARPYLSEMLRYDWNEGMKAGVARFFDLAFKHGLIAERRVESYRAVSRSPASHSSPSHAHVI